MKRQFVVLWICVLLSRWGYSQEWLGIRNSRYAGIQGVFLNPSTIATSALRWDVQFGASATLFNNNFLYAPRNQVRPFGVSGIINGALHENLFETRFSPKNPYQLYQFTIGNEVMGPSFYSTLRNQVTIGFSMALRNYGSIRNITGHLAQNLFADFKDSRLWNQRWQDHSFELSGLSWIEYGFHGATVIKSNRNGKWSVGISANYLQGLAAAYLRNPDMQYTVTPTSLLVQSSSFDYGGTKFAAGQGVRYENLNHGMGFSTSVGISYLHFRSASCFSQNKGSGNEVYDWKLGISALDLGQISFTRNTAAYHFESDSTVYQLPASGQQPGNYNQGLVAIMNQYDKNKVETESNFTMALPTAISLQLDWRISNFIFANTTIIKGLGHPRQPGIKRPDVYSMSVRYETDWFEITVPFSLLYYGTWQPRMGIAVRIGYFYFGGDSPADLAGINDFKKVDVYAGIHFFPLSNSKKQNRLACPRIAL